MGERRSVIGQRRERSRVEGRGGEVPRWWEVGGEGEHAGRSRRVAEVTGWRGFAEGPREWTKRGRRGGERGRRCEEVMSE